MEITVSEISTSSGLREFIHLPSKIHAGSRYFIAPFFHDEFKFHDEACNASLKQSDVIRLIANKNGVASGRIMGIVFHPWNRRSGLTDARFFQLDCINDPDVASALLNAVEQWAKSKGMNRLIGPFGFSDKDPQGLQTEGFEFDPVIAAATNEPYLPQLIERLGFEKFKDCVSYRLDIPETMPELHTRAAKRLQARSGLHTIGFESRKSLKPWIIPVMRLMNAAYKDIYGFMPLTENEIQALADQYLPLLDPKLVKVIADNENQPAAFIIAMPNISKGLKKAAGRIFPFGWIHILLSMRNATRLDLLLGGIADQYKGRGLSTLLGIAIFEEAKRKGLSYLDSHLILEENRLMRAEIENLGGTVYKRYRIYSKQIP